MSKDLYRCNVVKNTDLVLSINVETQVRNLRLRHFTWSIRELDSVREASTPF